jgi:hypothetical protein
MANLRPLLPQPQARLTVSGCGRPICVRVEIDNPTLAILLALGLGAVVFAATRA